MKVLIKIHLYETLCADILKTEINNHLGVWRNRDESANFQQKHDSVLVKEEKRVEVESEIRVQVDELMREELSNLKMVMFAKKYILTFDIILQI